MQNEVNIEFIILASAFFALLMVAFVTTFLFVTQKRSFKYNENLALVKKEYESAILNSQIEVQATTLQQVSEELHDNIGQLLSSVLMFMEVLGSKGHPEMQSSIEDTKTVVTEIKEQVRHISRSISPKHIEDFGLSEAIGYQTDRINRIGAINVEFKVEGTIKKFIPGIEIVMFRMVQELMNNAIKHSECENIWITVSYEAEKLSINVRDDGKGFNKREVEKNKQFKDGGGLNSLENKARNIQCSISFNSSQKGTNVLFFKNFE